MILTPRLPTSEEKDYTSYLLNALKAWSAEIEPMITDSLTTFRDGWVDSLFNSIRLTWDAKAQALTAPMRQLFRRLDAKHHDWWFGIAARLTGSPDGVIASVATEPWREDALSGRMAENVRLIKNIGDQAANDIERIIRDGIRSGIRTKEIAKQVHAVLGGTKARAQTIARDQVSKHLGALAEHRQRDAGIDSYFWSGVLDSRERATHLAREGKLFQWDSPPPDGHPGQPINCRCNARPNIPDEIYGFPVQQRYKNAQYIGVA